MDITKNPDHIAYHIVRSVQHDSITTHGPALVLTLGPAIMIILTTGVGGDVEVKVNDGVSDNWTSTLANETDTISRAWPATPAATNAAALFQTGKRWLNGSVRDHYAACAVCGATVGKDPKAVWVDIGRGCFVVNATDDRNLDDIVPWPVGSECLRKHPELAPFMVKA